MQTCKQAGSPKSDSACFGLQESTQGTFPYAYMRMRFYVPNTNWKTMSISGIVTMQSAMLSTL